MKKFILLFPFLLVSLFASAQKYAIGGRLINSEIGNGTELSFQMPFNEHRLELTLGISANRHANRTAATAMYQWVTKIGGSDFNWYVGAGAALGIESYSKDLPEYNSGLGISAGGQAGIEYNFSFPLQLSVDSRPMLSIIPNTKIAFTTGVSARYRF